MSLSATVRPHARACYLATRRTMSRLLIERRRGLETAGEVSLEDLGLASADRVRYEPSGWLDLRRILRPGEVGPDDVFVDFGAGKGRVLIQAARYPFARVVGVELSPELSAIARANVAAAAGHGRSCANVEVVTSDVAAYEVPDDLTVAYLYNPFRGEVFDTLVQKLIASVDRAPRTLRLIYRTPMEHGRLEATGRFRLVRTARGLRPGRAWSQKMAIRMYVLEPRSAA